MYVDVIVAVESHPFFRIAFPFNFEMTGVKEEDISQTIFSPPVAKEIKSAAAELLGVYADDIHDFLMSFRIVSESEYHESTRDSWIDADTGFVKVKKLMPMNNVSPRRVSYRFNFVEDGPFAEKRKCVVEFPSFAELFRFNVRRSHGLSELTLLNLLVFDVISKHMAGKKVIFYDDFAETDAPADIGFNIHLLSYKN